MNSTSTIASFCAPLVALALLSTPSGADAVEFIVAEEVPGQGYIGAYTMSGTTISSSFASLPHLAIPFGIAASNSNLYVSSENSDAVSQFTLAGQTVNQLFIPHADLSDPVGMALMGNNLYVANWSAHEVSEFNATTGVLESQVFINLQHLAGSFAGDPWNIAISGNDLYVISGVGGETYSQVGEYNATTGAVINASLVTLPSANLDDIAISGNNLFISSNGTDSVGVYNATTGATINSGLITGLGNPAAIAIYGNDLFVLTPGVSTDTGQIAEYTTSGTLVHASLVSGLGDPYAFVIVPEPSTWVMLAIGAAALLGFGTRKRRSPVCP
jgi:PEP-CTERM motif